jgi:Fur family transcriptional regulator, ferric uptake regulator
MCLRCNYAELLETGGLEPTPSRIRVLEVIGNNSAPVSAQEIFKTVRRTADINRVTVYRILEVLVKRGLVEKLSGGGRSLVYGLGPNQNHPAHPHFRCRSCGVLQCLQPGSLKVDLGGIERSFVGEIRGIEIRVDGICKNCLKNA